MTHRAHPALDRAAGGSRNAPAACPAWKGTFRPTTKRDGDLVLTSTGFFTVREGGTA